MKNSSQLLNECPCSSHPPHRSCFVALVEGGLGSSCGFCAVLGLGWRWNFSFWSPSRSPQPSLSSTQQILLIGLQKMQVECCSPYAQLWGKWGWKREHGQQWVLLPSSTEVCWLGAVLSSPNLLSQLQVRKKAKQRKKEFYLQVKDI